MTPDNSPVRTKPCADGAPTRHQKRSWRTVPTVDPLTVASTVEGMAIVTRAVYELGELDPCLLLSGQRLRLRLLIDRLLGEIETAAVGDAVSALYALRRRGFPVSGISEVLPPRKSRDVARRVIQDLRRKWSRTGPDKIQESLWVETTLDFLETPSRGR